MAELMKTANGARSQTFLALAAKRSGREELSAWLRRRVELLVDVNELTATRPVLKELWPDATVAAAAAAATTTATSAEDEASEPIARSDEG
jgi:hypothetical protein